MTSSDRRNHVCEIPPDSESRLIARARDGDVQAFTTLVTQHLDAVTRFAYYLLGSHDAADDVAQRVFVWLWEHRQNLDPARPVKSYLLRAARNRVFDDRKADSVRNRYRTELQAEMGMEGVHASDPHSEDATLNAVTVQAAIDQLPERRQMALRLRIEDDMSHAEIAEVLGLSPEAAQRLVSRALGDLRKILQKFGV